MIRWESWALSEEADRRFRRIIAYVGVPILILAIFITLFHFEVEKKKEEVFETKKYVTLLPPKPIEPPQPVAPKAPEQNKSAPKAEAPKPHPMPKPRPSSGSPSPKIKVPKPQPSAREQAERALRNVMPDELADLRNQDLNNLSGANPQVVPSTVTSAGGITASELAGGAVSNSGGIGGSGVGITGRGSGPGVGNRRTGSVGSSLGLGGGGKGGGGEGGDGGGGRTYKEIQAVFDQHQMSFYALYRHARLENDQLQGVVNLYLVIAPDGSVTECHVSSSELNDPELERQVVEQVKLMHFKPKKVPVFTLPNYPVRFFPSS
jgi:TonB family protein